jgi:hypothetical protein
MKKESSVFCICISIIISIVNTNYLAAADDRGFKLAVKTPKGDLIDLYRDSYALIIGNSNYSNGWEPIPGAIRDVKEVADALEKHGFKITLKTDLTKDEFNWAINEFSLSYGNEENNRLLFYYAGHGFTRKMATGEELGYLVMVNAPLPEKDLIRFSINSVDMQSLITQAKMIKARHVLFMFDSCFSGSIINMRERVVPRSISDSIKYPVRQFITAGRANEPVPDHSVFKQVFLDLIEGRDEEPIPDNYVTGEELGLYLKTKVPEYNPIQHPQYGKIRDPLLDKGDFVFVLNRSEQFRTSDIALKAEKKPLAEGATKTEGEQIQSVIEQSKKPEAEDRRLEEQQAIIKSHLKEFKTQSSENETPKLASIPKEVQIAKIELRKKPKELTELDVKKMLKKYNFHDEQRNPGYFPNDFIANADGTITDKATGLMWQESGSSSSTEYRDAYEYIERLNRERFAGYSDWRMPTLEELASLIAINKINGVHIDRVFYNKQTSCWTADKCDSGYAVLLGNWIVNFKEGQILQATYQRPGPFSFIAQNVSKNKTNYVKAVRSVR